MPEFRMVLPIQAVQLKRFDGDLAFDVDDLPSWVEWMLSPKGIGVMRDDGLALNLNGRVAVAQEGDWIILDHSGAIRAMKPNAFELMYEST